MSTGVNISSTWPEPPQTRPVGTFQLQTTLPAFLADWSAWQYIVAFLASLIVYDQGDYERRVYRINQLTPFLPSYLPQTKGFHRWSVVQDPAHRSIFPSN